MSRRLPQDIDICQYVLMPKTLELTPVESLACCPPLTIEPISLEQAERIAPLVKALADPVRLRLLSLIASHAGREACVCDLNDAFVLSQPTISHHLKQLHAAGLIDRETGGVWVFYRLNERALADVGALLGVPAA